MLQTALNRVVKITYNCLSVDGDTSTNDMVSVMASGLAGNSEINKEDDNYKIFEKHLYCDDEPHKMLAKDGEGATKLLECTVSNAKTQDIAIIVAKSVITSSLLKLQCLVRMLTGKDLCAIGYADAEFDINKLMFHFHQQR